MVLTAAAFLVASIAFGWGSVVASYISPDRYPDGFGYLNIAGTNYIILTTCGHNQLYRLYPSNGSVACSYALPFEWTAGCDAGVIGGTSYIWVIKGDYGIDHICLLEPSTGSIYSSFETPGHDGIGIAFYGAGSADYIYHTDDYTHYLYRLDPFSGSINSSFYLGYWGEDLAYGGGYLWIAQYPNRIDMADSATGSTIASFLTDINYPVGVGYDPTGPYLWVGFGGVEPEHYIRVYELAGAGIAPASLGRVKAVYR
jgi:hypothetical protein